MKKPTKFKNNVRMALKNIKHSGNKYHDDDLLNNIDKWSAEGKCIHCGSEIRHNEQYDSMFCPKCKYWTEKICPDRDCDYCSKRPKYPPKIWTEPGTCAMCHKDYTVRKWINEKEPLKGCTIIDSGFCSKKCDNKFRTELKKQHLEEGCDICRKGKKKK